MRTGLHPLPSIGSHTLGSRFFQYLLCSAETCQIVSVAASEAVSGGSCGGISPSTTRVTARADAAIASRQYPPFDSGWFQQRSEAEAGDTNLERDHELSAGQRGEHVRHVGVARWRDVAFAKVVAFGGVESCRDCEGG